jgi:hypothetical protein
MGFSRQFDQFDPKTDSVPRHPFSTLPNIVSRARRILRDRNANEILTAAQLADWMIEAYFEQKKDYFVQDQLQGNGWALQYLAPEERNDAGLRELLINGLPARDNPDHYFDFDSPENLPEIEALKAQVLAYTFDDPGLPAELFAAMALWLVLDCLDWLKRKPETQRGSGPGLRQAAFLINDDKVHMSLAGEAAIKAMEAVSYAEHLRALELVREIHNEVKKELQQQKHNIEMLAEAKAAQRRTAVAREAAAKRHQEHAMFREYVIQYFEEHESEFKSAEDAAAAIAGKVVKVSHRTVVDWIRTHKKQRSAGKP